MMSAPLARFEPSTAHEASDAMRQCATDAYRVVVAGGGTHAIGDGTEGCAVLSTRGLRRILEYAPEDQTVTVEAGVTLAELDAVLSERKQRLALDVARPERSTAGGTIAANAFGPRRMRFGSPKDLILGVAMVRADGVTARAGGKVVKNVAGFDVAKLLVGSYGTLALIVSATLRVHPLPQAVRALRVGALDANALWDLVLALRERQLEPAAIAASRAAGATARYDADVLFEGFSAGVESQMRGLLALARERGWTAVETSALEMREADAAVRTAGPLRVRVTALPSRLAATDADAVAPLLASLDSSSVNAYPSLGIVTIAGTPVSPERARDAILAGRERIERAGGTLVVESLPDGDRALDVDRWGTPPAAFALMRELKARFDPDGRLGARTFVGGL